MKHHKRHNHDWQWSDEQGRYLCPCGASLIQPDAPAQITVVYADEPPRLEPPKPVALEIHQCWSCYGSGYSDYAPGQPCKVCGGWGYWESI